MTGGCGMLISMQKSKKPIALLLAAAIIAGCAFLGIDTLKRRIYPRRYSEYVEKYCEKYGVDLNLAYAVIHTESGFDSDAVSSLGACGLMQIMPETFDWLRSKDSECSERYSDIFDPETNIRYGLLFLSIIEQRFDSERLVIAAYHAGMGRVSSWLDDSSFSSDGVSLHTIPFSDTEYYVKKVECTKRIYEVLYPAGS